jgi:hypothetical protein
VFQSSIVGLSLGSGAGVAAACELAACALAAVDATDASAARPHAGWLSRAKASSSRTSPPSRPANPSRPRVTMVRFVPPASAPACGTAAGLVCSATGERADASGVTRSWIACRIDVRRSSIDGCLAACVLPVTPALPPRESSAPGSSLTQNALPGKRPANAHRWQGAGRAVRASEAQSTVSVVTPKKRPRVLR